jgi:SCY1-like protein 1
MGNSASSLPYSIGKQVSLVNDGWALHEGTLKSDGSAVSVFLGKKPSLAKTAVDRSQPNMMQLAPALHHFQNCKKLLHPHILKVEATLDTDNPNDKEATGIGSTRMSAAAQETGDLIVVTEPCITLESWLQTRPPPEQLAWGLESIVRALHFLHASANLCHGNLSPESFFVTPSGDVKLWNFSLVTNVAQASGGLSRHFLDWEGLITPNPYRSPERLERRWDAISAAGTHCMDSYGLGVLISHFFGSIPQPLIKAVQRLQTQNIRMRPRLQPLLKCPIFDTPYQKLQLQLEEFPVQAVEQKTHFWQNLVLNMQAGSIPENVIVYKLLPMMKAEITTICTTDALKSQDEYRREGELGLDIAKVLVSEWKSTD